MFDMYGDHAERCKETPPDWAMQLAAQLDELKAIAFTPKVLHDADYAEIATKMMDAPIDWSRVVPEVISDGRSWDDAAPAVTSCDDKVLAFACGCKTEKLDKNREVSIKCNYHAAKA